MKITRGKRATAKKILKYGVEGIGKSTLASQFPNPLVLDTEDGTNHLDVARVRVETAIDLEDAIHTLTRDNQGFKTLVIDSVDKAERLLIEQLLKKANKRSIEDFGFGKGYTMVAEAVARLLSLLDALVDQGVNVVLVGHATVKRVSPPDMDEGYDRYEPKLTKQSSPLVKEWADAILFCQYKTRLVEGEDGRTRAKGGKERVLHTERTAAFDAKNRFGLPAELPMTIEGLAPLFADVPAPAPASTPKQKGWRDRIADCGLVEQLGAVGDAVDSAESAGKLTPEQADTLRSLIGAKHEELSPQEVPT
jgi:hypothetical protein